MMGSNASTMLGRPCRQAAKVVLWLTPSLRFNVSLVVYTMTPGSQPVFLCVSFCGFRSLDRLLMSVYRCLESTPFAKSTIVGERLSSPHIVPYEIGRNGGLCVSEKRGPKPDRVVFGIRRGPPLGRETCVHDGQRLSRRQITRLMAKYRKTGALIRDPGIVAGRPRANSH